jgi:hypothetical protein
VPKQVKNGRDPLPIPDGLFEDAPKLAGKPENQPENQAENEPEREPEK